VDTVKIKNKSNGLQ